MQITCATTRDVISGWTLHGKPKMMCVGHYEIKRPTYKKFIEKENVYIST